MEQPIRDRLEHAARDLDELRDGHEAVAGAHGAVRQALDEGSHRGLRERLAGFVVDLENAHPAAAARLRELVDDLAEMGL